MQDETTNEQETAAPSRRRFLKAAAGAGVVGAVWSQPVIRGIPAYAADASSDPVPPTTTTTTTTTTLPPGPMGTIGNTFISWSPMRDNWDDNVGPGIMQSPSLGMGMCGTMAMYTATNGPFMLNLTANGNPGGSTNCGGNPGVISIVEAGCMFNAVSVTAGMIAGQGTGMLTWSGIGMGQMGIQMLMFNISCP